MCIVIFWNVESYTLHRIVVDDYLFKKIGKPFEPNQVSIMREYAYSTRVGVRVIYDYYPVILPMCAQGISASRLDRSSMQYAQHNAKVTSITYNTSELLLAEKWRRRPAKDKDTSTYPFRFLGNLHHHRISIHG
jgi:hypothetical protein